MLIDGEKYACESCVRGHRVSNCQHSDRPLQHINKKGRPVSQCQHCRTMRKSRAAHVKCDCGEKTSKCAHLQQPVEGHKETCCCNHGGRCTCVHKKEPLLDTVPETDSESEPSTVSPLAHPKAVTRRRRANTVHPDGALFPDRNGLHKSASKHIRLSQQSAPYHIDASNSANKRDHGSGSVPTSGCHMSLGGRRKAAAAHAQRRVRSETASPLMPAASYPPVNGSLPNLDLSRVKYGSYASGSSLDMFSSGLHPEPEPPIYSAGLSVNSADWGHYELADAEPGLRPSPCYGPASDSGYQRFLDFSSGSDQPPRLANTTSTSGEASEVEDFLGGADGDMDGFCTDGSSFLRPNGVANLSSIDYDSFCSKNSDSAALDVGSISMVEEDAAFWMPNYNDGLATMDESPDPLAAPSTFWDL